MLIDVRSYKIEGEPDDPGVVSMRYAFDGGDHVLTMEMESATLEGQIDFEFREVDGVTYWRRSCRADRPDRPAAPRSAPRGPHRMQPEFCMTDDVLESDLADGAFIDAVASCLDENFGPEMVDAWWTINAQADLVPDGGPAGESGEG